MSLNVVMNQQGGLTSGQTTAIPANLNPQIKSNAVQYTTQIDNRAAPMGKASAVMFRESGTVPYVMEGRNHLYSQQFQNVQPVRLETLQAAPRVIEQRPVVVEQRPVVVEQRPQQIIVEAPQVQRYVVQRPQHNFIESHISTGSQGNHQIQIYQVEIEKLQAMLREKMEECERWKMQALNQEAHSAQFTEIQSRATYLQQENVRLTTIINEHINEMEQWRRRCFELEGLRGVVHDRERLEAENRHLSGMIQDMSSRVNVYEDELNKNQQFKVMHSQEKEFYESELRRLSEMLEIKNREIADWVMRYQQTEFEISKSKDLESRIVVLGSEIERLHMILKTNLEEMDNYHSMIANLEQRVSQVAVLEARCLEQDAEIRRLRDSIEEWIAKYSKLELLVGSNEGSEAKLQALSYEIERLNQILLAKQRENDELLSQIRTLQASQGDFSNYETKVALLSQEIERLKSVNAQKESQLSQYLRYESDYNSMTTENNRLREDLQIISRETEEWRSRYSRLELEKNSSLPEYENKIALLTQEIERQNALVRFKEDDLNALRAEYDRLEIRLREASTNSSLISEYESKFALLSQEIERLNNMLRVKDEDISQWRSRYDQLEISNREFGSYKSRLTEYENKIALLSQEIERLNSMLRTKDDELYSFRSRYEQLEVSSREMGGYKSRLSEYENKLALLSQEVERLNSMLRNKDDEIYGLRRDIQNLEISSRESASYQGQIREYENKLALLSQEVERLNGLVRTKESDLYAMKSKFESLEVSNRELNTYQSRARDYENKLAMLSQEIERLNSMLRTKDDELHTLNSRVSHWETMQSETITYKNKLSDYESRFALMAQEVERLNVNLRNKESELADYRSKYSSLEYRLQEQSTSSMELTRIRGTLTEYENKLALLSQEVERLNSILRSKEGEIEEWRYKYSSLEGRNAQYSEEKMRYLVSEVDRLTRVLEENDRELKSYRARFVDSSNLQTRIDDLLMKFVLLCVEIDNLRAKLVDKDVEVDTIRRSSLRRY